MRLTQLDTAKFIAIFLVILSHSSMTSPISPFLFSFHVQLYFICFGFVFKDKGETIKKFILGGGKKLIYRLIVPFILLCLIFGNPLSIQYLVRILYGRTAGVPDTAHLWFLPCFFLSAYLYNLIVILTRRYCKLIRFTCFFALAFISSLLHYDSDICIEWGAKVLHLTGYGIMDEKHFYWGFPFTLNVSLSGCFFMYIGSLLQVVFYRNNILTNKYKFLPLFLMTGLIGFISYYINQKFVTTNFVYPSLITMSHAIYGNYWLFIVTSVSLTVCTICLACFVDNPLFSKYGKCTMEIYILHPFITGVVATIFNLLNFSDVGGFFLSLITLIICCWIIPFVRSLDSNLVGIRNNV